MHISRVVFNLVSMFTIKLTHVDATSLWQISSGALFLSNRHTRNTHPLPISTPSIVAAVACVSNCIYACVSNSVLI